jgi:DNA-binding SARP family transcriptional activator
MNQIETQMNKLRLLGMVKSWTALQETRKLHELSLTDGMEILLQAEEQERNNRRFRRLEYQAGFRYKASMEELRTDPARGIDKTLIATLATGKLYLQRRIRADHRGHRLREKLPGFCFRTSSLCTRF